MTAREFLTTFGFDNLDAESKNVILFSLSEIESRPEVFVVEATKQLINTLPGVSKKQFLLGVMVGFAASSPRVVFKQR